jgi:hypothetical protein
MASYNRTRHAEVSPLGSPMQPFWTNPWVGIAREECIAASVVLSALASRTLDIEQCLDQIPVQHSDIGGFLATVVRTC